MKQKTRVSCQTDGQEFHLQALKNRLKISQPSVKIGKGYEPVTFLSRNRNSRILLFGNQVILNENINLLFLRFIFFTHTGNKKHPQANLIDSKFGKRQSSSQKKIDTMLGTTFPD